MKGPRVMDSTGLPLHKDNQTIVKERMYLDEKSPNILYDEITTIDHAFTRPWTVKKKLSAGPGRETSVAGVHLCRGQSMAQNRRQ